MQLSNIVKEHGKSRSVSPILRSSMVKLTNSTEEFAILLHVSSYSNASSPRPYSPMLNGSALQNGILSPASAGLSRSRSAQASAKPGQSTPDLPHSALPLQTFKLPLLRRLREKDSEIPG